LTYLLFSCIYILDTKVDKFVKEIFMTDCDQEKLKAEIDGIIKNIDNTMKKIENIIPVKQDVPDGVKSDTCEKSHDSMSKK